MHLVFKTVLSMSLSGALLILALLFVVRLLRGKLGRQWQYYVWLIVVFRLFLPFGPEVSLMGEVHRAADRAMVQMAQENRLTGQSNAQSLEQDESVTGSGESMPSDSQKTTVRDTDRNTAGGGVAYPL